MIRTQKEKEAALSKYPERCDGVKRRLTERHTNAQRCVPPDRERNDQSRKARAAARTHINKAACVSPPSARSLPVFSIPAGHDPARRLRPSASLPRLDAPRNVEGAVVYRQAIVVKNKAGKTRTLPSTDRLVTHGEWVSKNDQQKKHRAACVWYWYLRL